MDPNRKVNMDNERDQRFERSVRFVARHYREDALDEEQAWRKFAAGHAIRRRVSLRRYWIAAAVVSLLVGIGTFFMLERGEPDWVAVSTAPGQLKDVYLPDSTLVALAGDSWLRYDAKGYDQERRAVEMKGKAFFQVRRNTARPFSVTLSHTEVEVLGTSFQVAERTGRTEVDVVTGKVRFAALREKREMILTAGMSARYTDSEGDMTLIEEPGANKMAWRTGRIAFNDTPLEQVMSDLSDFYQVTIVNRSANRGARLTASFDNQPLDEVLLIINQTLDAHLVAKP